MLSPSLRPPDRSESIQAPGKSRRWKAWLTAEGHHESSLQLLRPDALIKTGPIDHADWNYKPILGWIQQQRFKLALSLLPKDRAGRILEIGYGSGVFLPELSRHCEELHGIDIHGRNQEIAGELVKQGVSAQLRVATAEALPFESEYFDHAVAVSSLEFVVNLPAACQEIARVLKRNGSLIVVTPGHSSAADLGLWLLTGQSAKRDFGERRQSLMTHVLEQFCVREKRLFPTMAERAVCLYKGFRLQPVHGSPAHGSPAHGS